MTHDEFITKYNEKFVEVAGSANALNQCVDLVNAYLREVLNHPIVEWTNAIDFPERLLHFEWVEYVTANVPQQGDLMIFFGQYGHISIFIEGDVNSFKSFDQNFPINSFCHIQKHNYNSVFGWLRSPESKPMSTHPSELMQIEKKDFEKLVTNSNTLDYLCDKLSFPRNSGGQTIIKRMSEINDNLATEKVAKHDQYNRGKIAEVLGVGAGETFEDLLLMIKELKDQFKPAIGVSGDVPAPLPETDNNKSIVEAVKDPMRYIVSLGIGVFLTYSYTRFPILGELQPDQQGLATFLISLVVKGLDKYQHKSGSSLKLPF